MNNCSLSSFKPTKFGGPRKFYFSYFPEICPMQRTSKFCYFVTFYNINNIKFSLNIFSLLHNYIASISYSVINWPLLYWPWYRLKFCCIGLWGSKTLKCHLPSLLPGLSLLNFMLNTSYILAPWNLYLIHF